MDCVAAARVTSRDFRVVCETRNVRGMTLRHRALLALTPVVVLAACGNPPAPSPAPAPRRAPVPPRPAPPPPLPPIPLVIGPLQPKVVYPAADHLIESPDSNYVFGSLGNGKASLTVNGVPAHVYPNGAFMVWLANPPRTAPRYDLVATLGHDTARVSLPVRLEPPAPVLASTGPLVVDSESVAPSGTIWLRDSDAVRVSVRAPRNASVTLATPGETLALASNPADTLQWVRDVTAAALRGGGTLIVARGADTVRLPVAAIGRPDSNGVAQAVVVRHSATLPDTDYVISGRPIPGDTYRWFLMPGTKLELTGRMDDYYRVRLDSALEIWVSASDVDVVPAAPLPRRIAGNARLRPAPGWVDLVIPIAAPPAYFVEPKEHALELTLYGTQGNTDLLNYPSSDSLVRDVEWDAPANDRVRYTVQLHGAPYGWLVMYEPGHLVLRVRRPPVVDPRHPLFGRTIAIDPGHPPSGATGPTGLYEGDAVLAVGARVRQLLEQRGVRVVMTRTTSAPVELGLRPVIARRANADAFVSIHLNAYPDGVDPFTAPNGSGTYFYRGPSEPLARAVQRRLLANLGLADEGYFYRSLAVVRPPWVPSILTEGAFVIIPQQESALRTPQFQLQYATAIVEGLEDYFRAVGTGR